MMTATLAHDLTALSAAVAGMCAHTNRRDHTRLVLRVLRAANDHQDTRLPDDDARTAAAYYHARREYWRGLLTTEDAAAADDAAAVAALALGAPAWHREED